jgi:hypothetical protein
MVKINHPSPNRPCLDILPQVTGADHKRRGKYSYGAAALLTHRLELSGVFCGNQGKLFKPEARRQGPYTPAGHPVTWLLPKPLSAISADKESF